MAEATLSEQRFYPLGDQNYLVGRFTYDGDSDTTPYLPASKTGMGRVVSAEIIAVNNTAGFNNKCLLNTEGATEDENPGAVSFTNIDTGVNDYWVHIWGT